MVRHRTRMAVGALLLGLALTFTTPASVSAEESGGYAGGVCAPRNKVSPTAWSNTAGGLWYMAASPAEEIIVCSTIRTSSSSPTTFNIDYYDKSTARFLLCTAHVYAWNGALLWSGGYQTTSASGISNGSFAYTIPSTMLGYVSAICGIPGVDAGNASGILGIRLQ